MATDTGGAWTGDCTFLPVKQGDYITSTREIWSGGGTKGAQLTVYYSAGK